MYISKIKIENFRNLKEFEIELKHGLNVILGENNVGKTNFVTAVRMALNSFFDPIEPINLSKEDIYKDENGVQDFSNPINVTLQFSEIDSIELEAEFLSLLSNDSDISKRTAILTFAWSWNDETQRYTRGWRGGIGNNSIDSDIFQSLPITFLGALRDALRQVIPGRKNYLSDIFTLYAADNKENKTELVENMKTANESINSSELVKNVECLLNKNLEKVCGQKSFKQEAYIETCETDFEQIIKNLKINLKGNVQDLSANGLGYNNLICISIIIAKLCLQLANTQNTKIPLLIIEEPEAHLHPQLQSLLSETLENNCTAGEKCSTKKVQTIVTSHSAIISANVEPESLHLMHKNDNNIWCMSLWKLKAIFKDQGLNWNKFKRLIDINKATMFFAKGIIFVEGITEAMLMPVLAKQLDFDLKEHGISVIPCGVEFKELATLYSDEKMSVPVAIITDSDPETEKDKDDKIIGLKNNEQCSRTKSLISNFDNKNSFLKVFPAKITLEYDLAESNKDNLDTILNAWTELHPIKGKALSQKIKNETDGDKKAEYFWLDVYTTSKNSKAEFMEKLIDKIETDSALTIIPPEHIKKAVEHINGIMNKTEKEETKESGIS